MFLVSICSRKLSLNILAMRIKIFLVLFISLITINYTFSQNTLILQADAINGKDALLSQLNPDVNYGTHPDFISFDWTFTGVEKLGNSLLQFDLSSIPSNVIITDAKLSLFYNSNSANAGQEGENACYLKKVISPWDETTVTWNTAPATTMDGAVSLSKSSSVNQDYPDIDITNLVKDWYSNPSTNYGVMLELVNKTLYSSMKFCSSDASEFNKRPKLEICYTPITLDAEIKMNNSFISVYPNPTKSLVNIAFAEKKISNGEIIIFNTKGEELIIQKITKNRIHIDLSKLQSGVYIVKVTTGKTSEVKKIIKE
jgi:hypothetical protein